MNSHEYLGAIRRALSDLPADALADIVLDLERHFIDGKAQGRSEADLSAGLGPPREMAAEIRASLRLEQAKQSGSLRNFGRLLRALLGMFSFNLLVAIPALVVPLLIVTFFSVSIAFGVAGLSYLASGITGVDRVVLSKADGRLYLEPENNQVERPSGKRITTIYIGYANINAYVKPLPPEQYRADQPAPFKGVIGLFWILMAMFVWKGSIALGKATLLKLAQYAQTNRRMLRNLGAAA
ncbi:MAG: DUF1700 domain-containing protein [Pseudomonadota bacterium]